MTQSLDFGQRRPIGHESYERSNKYIRKLDLMIKQRKQFHRVTRAEKNPRAYTRKEKYRINYMEIIND